MDRTNSLGLWNYGKEFYEAAELTRKSKDEISIVAYYLVCHSLELFLKAYLRGRGYNLDDLKSRLGHNLEKILKEAQKENIEDIVEISDQYRTAISIISEDYNTKEFEYITIGSASLPHIDILLKFAEEISRNIKEYCYKQMGYHDERT